MSVWIAILLGLVQGLCEFLPVSSSGHLVLLQTIFGIEGDVLFFDTMLHVGTLFAVCLVFRKSIWAMLRHPIQKKVGLLLLSTAVTTLIALLFGDLIETSFGGDLLGIGFLFTALILLCQERFARGKKRIRDMRLLDAAGVGLIQGIAILPGISRSGSTIAGARFFGLSKEEAAEFSFLLSIPAIAGSLVLQIPDVMQEGTTGIPFGAVFAGMIVAAISGYFAIRFMLRLIREKSLMGFAVYVGVLGIFVLADQLFLNLFFERPF